MNLLLAYFAACFLMISASWLLLKSPENLSDKWPNGIEAFKAGPITHAAIYPTTQVFLHPMIRAFLLLLVSTLSLFAEEKPWPGVESTEVRAYAWQPKREGTEVIKADMSPEAGVINPEGALLSPDQVKRLLAAVRDKQPPYPIASCHILHHAFVFYNADKKPVAFVELCFACRNHRVKPATASTHLELVSLATIFSEHKLPLGHSNLETFKNKLAELRKAQGEVETE